MQFSMPLRNAMMSAVNGEPTPKGGVIGDGAMLLMYAGDQIPGNCEESSQGILLCAIKLPSPWMSPPRSGAVKMASDWRGQGLASAGTGTKATYFRICDRGGKDCHIQGTITHTTGGGDMTLNNVSIAENQSVTVTGFNLTAGNA